MSSKLKSFDLTGAAVGTTGTIDFNQFTKFLASNIQEKAHIRLMNESGCGLDVTFKQSGNYHFLPAGGWGTFDVEPNDSNISAVVTYVLPNPPVSLLAGMYYAPGEAVPASFTLGNSPIGIGGTVNTSSVQTLSNEGSAAGSLILDIGDVAIAQIWKVYTDHFTIGVDQNGTFHQVLKGDPLAGNAPLDIGQAGDVTAVLGSLNVAQQLQLAVGTLSRISFFTGTEVATGSLHNHGLGVTPDYVFITMTNNGPDTCSFFYDPATLTSTQVKIYATNGVGTPRGFVAVAIKL